MKYTTIKSFRKTMALQIKNGELIVKVPYFITKKHIEDFIEKHKDWIQKKMENSRKSIVDESKILEYKKQAKLYIPKRVSEIAELFGVQYNKIRITSAVTRWGSCSSKKNLNFTYRLILTPKEVIDYVIIHELSHIKEMNHSKRFWAEVERMMPDYKIHESWLKKEGDLFTM